jgi:hypothetical protein
LFAAALAGIAIYAAPERAWAGPGGATQARILHPWSMQLQRRYSGLYGYGHTPGFMPRWVYAPVHNSFGRWADPEISVCYRVRHAKVRKGKRARSTLICN